MGYGRGGRPAMTSRPENLTETLLGSASPSGRQLSGAASADANVRTGWKADAPSCRLAVDLLGKVHLSVGVA